ncbi:MAG: (Fe-S)-binding protein [Elusimicrobiaceae bacterium]|nr:(Fe-S)-binding protein [Elusimicrobiaceae bacterium]
MDELCLEPLHPQKHLQMLYTPFGKRTLYNSVCYCTRCAMCAQTCPVYRLSHQETLSPRGRNQVLRLALEGKIKLVPHDPALKNLLLTCTLCGRCSQACAGKIPTAEHVLEMRRALHLRVLPRLLHYFLQLRNTFPRLFYVFVRISLFLRNLGLLGLARRIGLTRLPGFSWLNRMDGLLPPHISTLPRLMRQAGIKLSTQKPSLIYLPSLEAEFILPQIAVQTLRQVQKTSRPTVWFNTPSGLFSYIYGDLRQSRQAVRRIIQRHSNTANGNLPLLTDSIDVYHFLKKAPQLFSGNDFWEERARHLADCLRFVTDFMPANEKGKSPLQGTVQLEYGALFKREGKPFEQAEQILSTFFGKNFVHCLYTDPDVVVFGYDFTIQNCAEKIGLEVVKKIARTQTKHSFALSGLAALELTYYLKQFYPAAQAEHLVFLAR